MKPLVLIILDGWGQREALEYNAIANANTPCWDKLWRENPHCTLSGSGLDVGLPEGQMGNSEVGHLTMGAGRRVNQDLTDISEALKSGVFFQNIVFKAAFEKAIAQNSTLHILGLLSPGGVHSHEEHIHAVIDYAKQTGVKQIAVHCFLDGRDTPPRSAKASLLALDKHCHSLEGVGIASISGRYYAMDRDKRYDRIQKVYELLTKGEAGYQADTAILALDQAYLRGETDEFVTPTLISLVKERIKERIKECITERITEPSKQFPTATQQPESLTEPSVTEALTTLSSGIIRDNDVVIFMNFRADRARQLSYALTDPEFQGFKRSHSPELAAFVTLTEYAKDIQAEIAFPSPDLHNILGECLQNAKMRQLRLAETEKYAHVTFFFNGGREQPFLGEDRILVPSKPVATYDKQPEMSAVEVTDKLVEAILQRSYDVIICNFANADMLGHTGDFAATVQAVEVLDQCLARVVDALQKVSGQAIITADHGNAEYMFDKNLQQPHTAHTLARVPFVYIGRPADCPYTDGLLSDIAPTMLRLLGLTPPKEMTGRCLVDLHPYLRYRFGSQ